MVSILGVSNSTLEPPTNLTLEPPITLSSDTVRSTLQVTCSLKTVLHKLALAEVAITEQKDRQDVEISALQIVMRKLYQQSCEWVCNLVTT